MIRLLALHGYTQNAYMFSKKLGAIRKACAKDIEFVFVDGPIVLQPADLPGANLSEFDSEGGAAQWVDDPKLTARAWWRANDEKTEYYGLEDSLRYLRDILEKERFHGILGFSQGACMAAYLAAYLEEPSAQPMFNPPPHPAFDFAIFISGFAPMCPPIEHHIRTKNVHILGRTDTLVSPKRSETLVDICIAPRVEYHEGSHYVPSKASWRHFFHQWMAAFSAESIRKPDDIPSPVPSAGDDTPSGAQTPASGTMTPRGVL
ncbi:FSH1-domain-containing protein [Dacryopinax primogenitus]|uniref:FSH1-domain-containing protein n=1 Tax=Dacryopinax primogenitus (strain DJM 731) TaxID=1858805 RepID=M5FQD9_DACPD|nr:FSH1-domain-containing protein [Dacryopinax primogenitus]EJT96919.1 FSH1-domain-containing protein [Dacryopinax primogenitus]